MMEAADLRDRHDDAVVRRFAWHFDAFLRV
jgi:hypothetical protein